MTKNLSDRETTGLDNAECLWIGFLGVKPLEGCEVFDGDPVAGAYVYFITPANGDDDFRSIATDMSQRVRLEVNDIDDVKTWRDWSRTATRIDPYFLERAAESEKDGQPKFCTFHRYLKDDGEAGH